jgi:formylglycine-generating enzyme required for sulfatase activity
MSTYYWGEATDTQTVSLYAWYSNNSQNTTHEVGLLLPNAWGLYDMAGNVCQWCWDWNGNYSSTNETNPMGPVSGVIRIYRGGSFGSDISGDLEAAYRDATYPASYGFVFIGFRICVSVR